MSTQAHVPASERGAGRRRGSSSPNARADIRFKPFESRYRPEYPDPGNRDALALARGLGVCPKLEIGFPGDPYEREADRIAERIVRRPDRAPGQAVGSWPLLAGARVQRACRGCEDEPSRPRSEDVRLPAIEAKDDDLGIGEGAGLEIQRQTDDADFPRVSPDAALDEGLEEEEEEEEEEEGPSESGEPSLVQTKWEAPPPSGSPVPRAFGRSLRGLRGGGRPLPPSARDFFEPRFGFDFSRVRIHEGRTADSMAGSIRARAFTSGRDIVFASGEYDPGSDRGRRLVAHELAHVVQQRRRGGVQPLPLRRAPNERPTAGSAPGAPGLDLRAATGALAIQAKRWGPCPPGRRVGASSPMFWGAAELAGVAHHRSRNSSHTIISNPTPVEHFKPTGRYERRLKRALVNNFRGISNLLRPDILDLTSGEVYDVKTSRGARAGVRQIQGYITILKAIETAEGLPPRGWRHGTTLAPMAPYVIPLRPRKQLLCFGITNFARWKGILKYMVIDPTKPATKKKKKKKKKGAKKKATGKPKPKPKPKVKPKSALKGGLKKGLKKGATKTALKGVAKKFIPGEVYLELGMYAVAIAGGAKPKLGGGGMSVEEAVVDIALHGKAPDVTVSDDLQKLFDENPKLKERIRKLSKGQDSNDAVAQEMINLLEQNLDKVDARALEGLVAAAEKSKAPISKPTKAKLDKLLKAVKSGRAVGTGTGGPGTGTKGGTKTAPKTPVEKAKGKEEKGGETKKPGTAPGAGKGPKLDPKLAQELKTNPAVEALYKSVLGTKGGIVDDPSVRRILAAVRGLSDDQVKKITQEIAKLPKVTEQTPPEAPTVDAVQRIEQLANQLKQAAAAKPQAAGKPGAQPQPGQPAQPSQGKFPRRNLTADEVDRVKKAIAQFGPKIPPGRDFVQTSRSLKELRKAYQAHKAGGSGGTLSMLYLVNTGTKKKPAVAGSIVKVAVTQELTKGAKYKVKALATTKFVDQHGSDVPGIPTPRDREFDVVPISKALPP